jgi:hypothetical protein
MNYEMCIWHIPTRLIAELSHFVPFFTDYIIIITEHGNKTELNLIELLLLYIAKHNKHTKFKSVLAR